MEIKSILNGNTPSPPYLCNHIDEYALLRYQETVEDFQSKNKPIGNIKDYSICCIPSHNETCPKHSPSDYTSTCTYIHMMNHEDVEKIKLRLCDKPCNGPFCLKHVPRLTCRIPMATGQICKQPCKIGSTTCYRHQETKNVDQYKSAIPPWYMDLNTPYVPRFITGSIVDCCKAYKSSFGLFNAGHIKKFDVAYRTKKDRYQSVVIEKTCFSSTNTCLPKYFKNSPLTFGVLHTKKHGKIKFKELEIKYDGRLVWDSKLDKWFYIYASEKPVQCIENQDASSLLPKRQIAFDLGIKTPGTAYSPNGHLLTLDIKQSTSDILAQIEELKASGLNSRNKKRRLKHLNRMYKYRNDLGGELYGYLLAQDKLRSRIDKTKSKQKKKLYWKVFYRLSSIITNKIDDFHWRCIKYLTDNYDCISVGEFKVKQIVQLLSDNHQAKSARILLTLRFGKFMSRLKEKCKDHNKVLHIQNEACTSKTCSGCGWYNHNLGRSRTFICLECNLMIDRDVNAARNIYLRSWLENGDEFRFPMHASASLNKGVPDSCRPIKTKENHRDECFK